MSRRFDRGASLEGEQGRGRRAGFVGVAAEDGANATRDAFLPAANPVRADIGAALARADGAICERVLLRLQRERGNAYVQRIVAAARAARDAGRVAAWGDAKAGAGLLAPDVAHVGQQTDAGRYGEQRVPHKPGRAAPGAWPGQREAKPVRRRAGDPRGTLARQRNAPDPPTDVTIADPLPAGANVAHPDQASVVADPSLPGGWTDPGGRTTTSGTVGGVDRILIEGVSGNQQQQPTVPDRAGNPTVLGAGQDLAQAAGSGPGPRGRAVALVPHSVRAGQGGEIAVLVHFHGTRRGSTGMRERGARPEDVRDFQLEQQLEAFLGSRPGARMIALLPVGITTREGRNVHFGSLDVDTFVQECFSRLTGVLPGGSSPGGVVLSGHSGGGLELSRMMVGGGRLPRHLLGVFGFESFHGDTPTWIAFVTQHLDDDLRTLERQRAEGSQQGSSADQIFATQASELRDRGFRFVALSGDFGDYARRTGTLRKAIAQWFQTQRARLRSATGGRHELLDQLWANYQAQVFPDSTHMNALATARNNLGRALATLPGVGALSSTPAAAGGRQPAPAGIPPAPAGASPAPASPGGALPAHGSQVTGTAAPAAPAAPVAPASAARTGGAAEPPHGLGDGTRLDVQSHQQAAQATQGTASQSTTAGQPQFRTERYPMSTREAVIVHADPQQHLREISASPAVYTAEILRDARLDPVAWYGNFTSGVRFLGRRVRDPIHVTLARHLRQVEGRLAQRYGGAGNDPDAAGRTLGLTEDLIGARDYPTSSAVSMHLFGLAVDVNYTANPFVSARANDVFERAGLLVEGRGGQFRSGRMSYEDIAALDATLTEYFRLLDDETALSDRLTAATAPPWRRMSVANAQRRIRADLTRVADLWARTDPGQRQVIQSGGFLDLSEALVQGMEMSWGGTYGDMMHFDLRTDGGDGQRIQGAIQRYLARQRRAAAEPT